MAVTSDNSPLPGTAKKTDNGAINDVTLPSVTFGRNHIYPIALFNDDYTECNGIVLSKMSPACASAASTNKCTVNDVGRIRGLAFSSSTLKKKHASSTLLHLPRCSVMLAAATLATSINRSVVLDPLLTSNFKPPAIGRQASPHKLPSNNIFNPLPTKKRDRVKPNLA